MRIAGYNIISSPHMVEIKYKRKQTRKFKNKRWCKKYLKKYSYTIPRTDCIINESQKTIFAHPSVVYTLETLERNSKVQMIPNPSGNSYFYDLYKKTENTKRENGFNLNYRSLYGYSGPIRPELNLWVAVT